MNTYAFFRLLWRPGTLVTALPIFICWGIYSLLAKANTFAAKADFWYLPDPANSFFLIIPFIGAGLLSGSILEVYNGPFSWTLPNLRRDFSAIAVIGGLLTAAIAVGAHRLTGGTILLPVAFSLAAFCYALNIYLHYRHLKYSNSILPILALFASIVLVDHLIVLATAHPLILSLLALSGSCALLYRACSPNTLRALKSTPHMSIFTANSYAAIVNRVDSSAKIRRQADRIWPHLGASAWRWIRACEYERSGHERFGAFTPHIVATALLLFMPALVINIYAKANDLALFAALDDLYYLIASLDLSNTKEHNISVTGTWMISGGFVVYFGWTSASFRYNSVGSHLDNQHPNFLYPLARAQRAAISFRSIVEKNVLYAAFILTIYYTIVFFCGIALQKPFAYVLPPTFTVALTFVLAPLIQWLNLHCWRKLFTTASLNPYQVVEQALALGAAFAVSRLSIEWMKLGPQWPAMPQIAAVLITATTVHYLLYRKIQQHYARNDLVR